MFFPTSEDDVATASVVPTAEQYPVLNSEPPHPGFTKTQACNSLPEVGGSISIPGLKLSRTYLTVAIFCLAFGSLLVYTYAKWYITYRKHVERKKEFFGLSNLR